MYKSNTNRTLFCYKIVLKINIYKLYVLKLIVIKITVMITLKYKLLNQQCEEQKLVN